MRSVMRLHIFTVAASSHYNKQTQQQRKIKQPVIPHRVNSWLSKPGRKSQSRASGPLMINNTSASPLRPRVRYWSTATRPNPVAFLLVWDDSLRRRWIANMRCGQSRETYVSGGCTRVIGCTEGNRGGVSSFHGSLGGQLGTF